jgi:mannose-6-phosphate isomerase-like protein (cupin superfamily)
VVGLDDVIVVSTADAVLVTSRTKAEQVKALVEQLKQHNHRAAVEHRRMYRPWGYYQDIDIAARYRVKRIVVKSGSTLSLQKHFHRSEHWVVVKGTAEVTIGNDVSNVHENESIYIPIGRIHRLANPGKIPLELIEVQVGSYLGEDDIVRLYGWTTFTAGGSDPQMSAIVRVAHCQDGPLRFWARRTSSRLPVQSWSERSSASHKRCKRCMVCHCKPLATARAFSRCRCQYMCR